jgi:methionyl-tRNA formyltransferase
VILPSRNDSETQSLATLLSQNKMPFFYYDEKDQKTNFELLKQIQCDIALAYFFPFKFDVKLRSYFNDHIFNIHASLLPQYRGSQPLFWQLKNGESKSALSLCRLSEDFDEGDIVLQQPFDIDKQDTFGILMGTVSQMVISLVEEFLELISKQGIENITALAQKGQSSYAPSLTQNEISIDWKTMNAHSIVNLVRACNPICGGAQTLWKNTGIAIMEATVVDMPNLGLEAGTILHLGSPEGFIVATIDGSIRIDIVSVADGLFSGLRFAKRFNIDAGDRLTCI